MEILDFIIGDSFILTMWYVNLNIRLALYLYVIGFILTMWYVNPKLKVGTGNKIQKVLY